MGLLRANGFEIESELILRAVKARLKIAEVPSVELVRRAGASNLNAVRDGCRVLRTIITERPPRLRSRTGGQARIELLPMMVPAPGAPDWLPAGLSPCFLTSIS